MLLQLEAILYFELIKVNIDLNIFKVVKWGFTKGFKFGMSSGQRHL